MTELIRLTIEPGKTPGRFVVTLLGEVIARSDQPLVDAARVLLARGFDPATPVTMRHQGSAHDSFLPRPIGYWAKVTYSETETSELRAIAWRPFPAAASGQKSTSEPPGGTRAHPEDNSLPATGRGGK